MIPILFSETEQNFTSNGIGRLTEALSCVVTEERNGEYTLSMTYPVQGKWFKELKHSRYIFATPSDGASKQPFRIYKISKPLNGKVTVLAQHRSYQLSGIPCGPFTASNVSAALQGLKDNAYETCDFTFWTDKSTIANYKQDEPSSIRSRLGGVQGSILDVYGGEFEFDNLTVKLHANRGVTLRYGKNITDINQEINIENTITGVCPFARDQSGNVIMLPEHVVYSPNASNFPEPKDAVIDFTEEFGETTPTVSALRAKANAYITANNIGVPAVNIKVSFVALWQTEEYKDVAALERVKLCDTVTVYFEKLGIEATAKVIKTEYDVLKDRYQSIELGEGRTNLASQIADINTEVKQKANVSAMQQAIDAATTLISGGLGGHVVFNRNANGEPEEILIMDTDDISTAVNVIRMNQNGIGFSTTGYNGPFTTAWTIDSHFNADFINAGTITGVAINNGNGTFTVDSGGALVASNATVKTQDTLGRTEIAGGSVTTYRRSNGNKGVEINGSMMKLHAWADNGNYVGSVGSTYDETRQAHYVDMWCDTGDGVAIGYKIDDTDTVHHSIEINNDGHGGIVSYRKLEFLDDNKAEVGGIKRTTFSDVDALYICSGYGKQLRFGYKASDGTQYSTFSINEDGAGGLRATAPLKIGRIYIVDASGNVCSDLGNTFLQRIDPSTGWNSYMSAIAVRSQNTSGAYTQIEAAGLYNVNGNYLGQFLPGQFGVYQNSLSLCSYQQGNGFYCSENGHFAGNFSVGGTKSRVSDTESYGQRLMYCYETATPYFGDIGEGKTDEFGECYIFLDDIFDETIEGKYQVFLQAYGEGALYVAERTPSYFIVRGEANTSFGWELKAPQNGYALERLEQYEPGEAVDTTDVLDETMNYLTNQLYNVERENYEEH